MGDGLVDLVGEVQEKARIGDGFKLSLAAGDCCRLVEQVEIGLFGNLDGMDRLAVDDGDVAAKVARVAVRTGEHGDERLVGFLEAEALVGDGEVESQAILAEVVARRHLEVDPGLHLLGDLRDAALGEAQFLSEGRLGAALVREPVVNL